MAEDSNMDTSNIFVDRCISSLEDRTQNQNQNQSSCDASSVVDIDISLDLSETPVEVKDRESPTPRPQIDNFMKSQPEDASMSVCEVSGLAEPTSCSLSTDTDMAEQPDSTDPEEEDVNKAEEDNPGISNGSFHTEVSESQNEASQDIKSLNFTSVSSPLQSDVLSQDFFCETERLGSELATSISLDPARQRVESLGSASSSSVSLGSMRDKEDFVSARESLESTASSGSERAIQASENKPCQLINMLVEGPKISLPLTQLLTPSGDCDKDAESSQTGDVQTRDPPIPSEIVTSTAETVPSCLHSGPDVALERGSSGLLQESVTSPVNVTDSSVETGSLKAAAETAETAIHGAQANGASRSPEAVVEKKPAEPVKARVKKTPNDFIFGKVLGEGSYSTVYLAKEVSSQKEFAIKVCDKKHLIRERKTHFVMREKDVLMRLDHPFFIKLAYTFQDPERLYYVLTYARNGELLGYLHKLSAFDVSCTMFYTAELVLALEYLHNLGIIHRDLKPENILLSDDMHIKITDFGTSKILPPDSPTEGDVRVETKRKNSFVGTAEYVSPEVLNNSPANFGSDLWALGCIIYQCLSGSLPFRSGNEYQTFQKIVKVDYDFPEGFHPQAKDLVQKLLVLDPADRLGMPHTGGMAALKQHPFFEGIDWENLANTTPPKLMPYLPATANNPEFWGQERTGFDDQRLAEIITGQNADGKQSPELEVVPVQNEEEEKQQKLKKQRAENPFHQFVENNLILRQGFVDKRKGLFARKRMLLLTEGPHLYYVDAHNKVLKGEIPWSCSLRPEAKNFKIFFVHTPHRTYYLESRSPDAQQWVKQIQEVWKRYFGKDTKR